VQQHRGTIKVLGTKSSMWLHIKDLAFVFVKHETCSLRFQIYVILKQNSWWCWRPLVIISAAQKINYNILDFNQCIFLVILNEAFSN